MASRQSFQLHGAKELKASLASLEKEIATKAGQAAVRAGANVIRNRVKAAAPLGDADTSRTYRVKGSTESRTADYGHLRDNIKVAKGKPRKAHTVVSLVTTGKAFWGRMVEFGTTKMSAQSWFKPASDAAAPEAFKQMMTTLEKALARAVKKANR